jgi:DNA-binding transcriptional ArsR family regulator
VARADGVTRLELRRRRSTPVADALHQWMREQRQKIQALPFHGFGFRLRPALQHEILNHMDQYSPARFDASFSALSDATRRGVLEQLMHGDASITDLAERFHMTLTGMRKHIGVLEQAELVRTEKVGRVRTCRLGFRNLGDELAWMENYRLVWAARFDALDAVIEDLKHKEKSHGRK